MILIIVIVIFILILYCHSFLYTEYLPYNIIYPIDKYREIPNIIYRTYNKRYVNRKMYINCHKKWIDLNPGFQVVWMNTAQCEKTIKNFSINVFKAYKKLKPLAFKADLWRLCILYQYGGVYADAYCVPYVSIKEVINKANLSMKSKFIASLDCKQAGGGIHNGFIISTPRHPFLKRCIKDIVKNVESNEYTDKVLGVTGPICLYRSIYNITKKKSILGLNKSLDNSYYLLKFNIGPSQYISDNGEIMLAKQYNFMHYIYRKILKNKNEYSYMWKQKDIYSNIYS